MPGEALLTRSGIITRLPGRVSEAPPGFLLSKNREYTRTNHRQYPLVKLQRLGPDNDSEVWVKLEGNNPAGSVKDRAALSMIVEAEKRGEIQPGDVLIEATSGNTGIALAMIAALKGYRMKLLMPDNMSRRAAMRAYGAELIWSAKSKGWRGPATGSGDGPARRRQTARSV